MERDISPTMDTVAAAAGIDRERLRRLITDAGDTIESLEASDLLNEAARLTRLHRGIDIDCCSIVNAKSGGCSEDCAYCAQSRSSGADFEGYPLMDYDRVMDAAKSAIENGAGRFCIVTGGRRPSRLEIGRICRMVEGVRRLGLFPCATLGILDGSDLIALRDAGLHRYHHNLETSRRYFGKVCTTHSYEEKLDTINCAKEAGLSICSAGIFGIGEDWDDRIDLALDLREIGVDSLPINYLSPIKGTVMGGRERIDPIDALKIISLYRLIMPDKEIRICGGRIPALGGQHLYIYKAGADGVLIGNYLTTTGRPAQDDVRDIKSLGLRIRSTEAHPQ